MPTVWEFVLEKILDCGTADLCLLKNINYDLDDISVSCGRMELRL